MAVAMDSSALGKALSVLRAALALKYDANIGGGMEELKDTGRREPIEDVLRLKDAVLQNAFSDHNSGKLVMGRVSSLFNHSCLPNANMMFLAGGSVVYARACKAVAAGEEITVSYGALMFPEVIRSNTSFAVNAKGVSKSEVCRRSLSS